MKLKELNDICSKYHVEMELKLGGKHPRAVIKSHTGDVMGFDFKFPKQAIIKIKKFAIRQSKKNGKFTK